MTLSSEVDHDCRGEIHYTEALEMLKNIDPPLGFGKKCPDKMAYKRLIRMNMPINKKGRVSFTTTLFALIRDNLKINVRESAEMDQADLELRATIMKMWPITRAGKIDLLGIKSLFVAATTFLPIDLQTIFHFFTFHFHIVQSSTEENAVPVLVQGP